MKNYEYWKDFVSSGKIDDYLHYIACTREDVSDEPVKGRDHSSQYPDSKVHDMNFSSKGTGYYKGLS
jgi:hypothetical protein